MRSAEAMAASPRWMRERGGCQVEDTLPSPLKAETLSTNKLRECDDKGLWGYDERCLHWQLTSS